jgi:glycosyltransferase involved in cell wall biosynthesis
MKILMIHTGPSPSPGSSNAYIDSVASGISGFGHDVVELHTLIRVNSIRSFHQKEFFKKTSFGTNIYTIQWINSGVYAGPPPGSGSGTLSPTQDVIPSLEMNEAFREILNRHSPDIVHIHALFGFPVKLTEEIKKHHIPYLITIQDYTTICPTSHLFLPESRPCDLSRDQLQCHKCCEHSKSYTQFAMEFFFNTMLRHLKNDSYYWKIIAGLRNQFVHLYSRFFRKKAVLNDYIVRYDEMIRFLNSATKIHCLSTIQAKRISQATGPMLNIRVIPVSPPAVVEPKAVTPVKKNNLLKLCVLNVHYGRNDKGYSYLLNVLQDLEKRRKDFHVDWYAQGTDTECINFHGGYSLKQLDDIAANTDFSITPSLWLETQAYTGVEMLSKGVPLICSKRAGVSEWVIDGVTGILFDPSTTKNLSEIIESLIDDREKVSQLRNHAMERAAETKTHQNHLKEIESLYADVMLNQPR